MRSICLSLNKARLCVPKKVSLFVPQQGQAFCSSKRLFSLNKVRLLVPQKRQSVCPSIRLNVKKVKKTKRTRPFAVDSVISQFDEDVILVLRLVVVSHTDTLKNAA